MGVGRWRPRQHLPADDPGSGGRDAGVRAHRRGAQRRLRRLQFAVAQRSHQRRRGQGAHHRRRWMASRRGVPAQGVRRRSVEVHAHHHRCRRGPSRRQRRADASGPRPLVPRADGDGRPGVRSRADGLRAAAVPALHLGHHRQAEGHHAHQRRLPHPGRLHPQVRVRPPRRHRRLLVHGRHRLGHRPQLHRLRTTRQRCHAGDVRGRAELPRQRSDVGHRREVRRHEVLHRAHRDPNVHEVGHRRARQARPVVAAAARLGR